MNLLAATFASKQGENYNAMRMDDWVIDMQDTSNRTKNDKIFGDTSKKIEFYSEAKTKNPNTTDVDIDGNFAYYQNCVEENIMPNPIQSKIKLRQLCLLNYNLSE